MASALARLLSWLARGLLLLAFGYALLCLLVFLAQRRLLYHPDPLPLRQAEAIGAETLALNASDGTRLIAWWIAPPSETAPVALYLHGNGANLDARAARLQALRDDGLGVLAVSWRGYGGSSGEPSEAGWKLDALAAYQELRRRGVPPSRILLYGESLGSTQALMLAAVQPVGALLLDSSFESALALAQQHYRVLPLAWLMRDPHRADLDAPRIKLPVLQVHCARDTISPLAHAERLQALLGRRSELLVLDGDCHVPSYARYRDAARAFVATAFGR